MENWKDIKGYEGYYQVSDLGNVRSLTHMCRTKGNSVQTRTGRILKQDNSDKRGYKSVRLCREGVTQKHLVHRLVASAFIPNDDNKPCVDHIDNNPNNNQKFNLRWVDWEENNNKEEHRERLRVAITGFRHSEESKRKMSETKRRLYGN